MAFSKLTPLQRMECGLRGHSGESYAALATEYGVAYSTVKSYVRRYRLAIAAIAAAHQRAVQRRAA